MVTRLCDICGKGGKVEPAEEWLGERSPGRLNVKEVCASCRHSVDMNIRSTLVVLSRGKPR